MTHITKFKPHAYYLAANFFVTLLDVKLNFCLNHRTPSHLTSMEGTREKTRMPLLELALSISPPISLRDLCTSSISMDGSAWNNATCN